MLILIFPFFPKKDKYHPFQFHILQSSDPITQALNKIDLVVLIQHIDYNCNSTNGENRLGKISSCFW